MDKQSLLTRINAAIGELIAIRAELESGGATMPESGYASLVAFAFTDISAKINACKLVRDYTGLGLGSAKEAIETCSHLHSVDLGPRTGDEIRRLRDLGCTVTVKENP